MPEAIKHPLTGCRYDTILGDWLAVEEDLRGLVETSWAVIEHGELQAISMRSAEIAEEANKQPYNVTNGIAKLAMSGPLTKLDTSMTSLVGGTSTIRVRKALNQAKLSNEIKGIFIEADSSGGTAEGTPELASAIREVAKVKPVFVHASDKACSAMLWAATQGTRFTCGPMANVGSLGAILSLMDTSKVGEKGVFKPVVITSGKYKAVGHPGVALTEEHIADLQRRVDQQNDVFKTEVAAARHLTAAQLGEVATAKVFIGKDAKRVGLVDDICTEAEAFTALETYITELAGRSPSSVKPKSAAPTRSNGMPLTADQIKLARELPGAASLSEENADVTLYNAAVALNTKLASVDTKLTANATTIANLERDLAAARATPGAKPALDAGLARAYCSMAKKEFKLLLDTDKITAGQHELLEKMIMADGKPNEIWLSPGVDGKQPYESVLEVFAANKPNGVVKEISGAQPGARTEPGAGTGGGKKPQVSMSRINELRIGQNMKPKTKVELEVDYPDAELIA